MTVLDIGNNITVTNSLPPVSVSTASVQNGASLDTKGYAWGVALFLLGNMHASDTNVWAVEESDDDVTFAVCDRVGSAAGAADASTTAAVSVDDTVVQLAIDFTNTKRYVRVTAKSSGANAQVYGAVLVGMPAYTGDATAPVFDV
tara:strand:- start:33541 stop:33975 length:435 start_codon:yes stop_codon:yes gene_type:complete